MAGSYGACPVTPDVTSPRRTTLRRHMFAATGRGSVMKGRLWGGAGALACALVAGLGGAASATVQVGSSGWSWGNPLPQGNTLRAMSFAGPTGYAVGDVGTLLKTA